MYFQISERDYNIITEYYCTPEMMPYESPHESLIDGRIYIEIDMIPEFAKKELIKIGTFTEEFWYDPDAEL